MTRYLTTLRHGLQLRAYGITVLAKAPQMTLLRSYSIGEAHDRDHNIFLDGLLVGYWKLDHITLQLNLDVWNIKTNAYVSHHLRLDSAPGVSDRRLQYGTRCLA
jgi:hypothetical protein